MFKSLAFHQDKICQRCLRHSVPHFPWWVATLSVVSRTNKLNTEFIPEVGIKLSTVAFTVTHFSIPWSWMCWKIIFLYLDVSVFARFQARWLWVWSPLSEWLYLNYVHSLCLLSSVIQLTVSRTRAIECSRYFGTWFYTAMSFTFLKLN